jgi:hypothetical protein
VEVDSDEDDYNERYGFVKANDVGHTQQQHFAAERQSDGDSSGEDLFSDAWSVQQEIEPFNDTTDMNGEDEGGETVTNDPISNGDAPSNSSFGSFPELNDLTIDDKTGLYCGLDIPMSQLTLNDPPASAPVAAIKPSPLPMSFQDRLSVVWRACIPGRSLSGHQSSRSDSVALSQILNHTTNPNVKPLQSSFLPG